MPSLTDIRFLQSVLTKLDAEKPAGTGRLGQTEHQDREGDLLQRLRLEAFSQEGKARVLLTGQIGVGKSSELWHFFRQRVLEKPRTGFWVYCDLEKKEHPERCGATGVFLTILRDCWAATKSLKDELRFSSQSTSRRFYSIRNDILERLIDWLKGERSLEGMEVIFRFGGMDFPVRLNDKDSALALILGKAAQHEAVSARTERFGLVPDKLVNLLNGLFEWLKSFHSGLSPLLIIDHVDKIRDETAAREVLVEVVPQWQRIKASIIMTAPYEFTLGEMRYSVESYWGKPLMVYPLPFPELDDETIPPFYEDLIMSCGLSQNIEFYSLRMLAHYSGGIPRTFVQFVIQSCKEAYLARHERIMASDAQTVVYAAERAYQDYGLSELELLDQIAESKTGLSAASTLLRSPIGLLVMSPEKGQSNLRIHPLAENLLERYRTNIEEVKS
ncbi:MAG: hypothetical protein ACE5G1_14445 [bacterium]